MNNTLKDKIEGVIGSVRKPSWYIGVEPNSVHKDHDEIRGAIALAFPDLYDIGMSHLGLKILYNIVNSQPNLAAERVFAPGEDYAEALAKEGLPFVSLETKKPLNEFDVVGFTIPYELSYTNILWMLDLGGIPLKAADRGPYDPLIVGGGAGVYNPEPVAGFFDIFLLGDGERSVLDILNKKIEMKGAKREELLRELARIPGVYVPSFFDVDYGEDGRIKKITPRLEDYPKAVKTFLPSLSESPYPVDLVVPFGQPVQDRLNVEIDRGCTQGCRFCQAGTTYRPVRERTPDEALSIMEKTLKKTGYDGISVTSLSAGDYSKISELLKLLMDRYADEKVSLSLPSLRSGTVTNEIIHEAGRVRKSSFTITAEAGSQRLRNVLNKKVTEEEIIRVAERLLASGWRSLKLYFMAGLPTETEEDIDAIYHLCAKLAGLNADGRRYKNISVSVGNFVPKAHTAFQWFGQNSIDELKAKKERLFSLIKKNRRLTLKWSDPEMSHMEAVFSRGDRRLGKVVEAAYRAGHKLDAWSEHFDFSGWMRVFKESGVDPSFYANRHMELDASLPWDHIDTGLTKKYFKREWKLAHKGEVTGDCRVDKCLGCGLNPKTCFENYEWKAPPPITAEKKEPPEDRFIYRLAYRKRGLSRFLSHLEVKTIFTRAFRMAEAPLRYSKGFSPHPKLSFGHPVPVGVESDEEFLDAEFYERRRPEALAADLNEALPAGLEIISVDEIPQGESIFSRVAGFVYKISFDESVEPEELEDAVSRFNSSESVVVEKAGPKRKKIDTRAMVDKINLDSPREISFTSQVTDSGIARPDDIIKALFAKDAVKLKTILKLSTLLKEKKTSNASH